MDVISRKELEGLFITHIFSYKDTKKNKTIIVALKIVNISQKPIEVGRVKAIKEAYQSSLKNIYGKKINEKV